MNELLPLIPYGATEISDVISIVNQNDTWTYFHGGCRFSGTMLMIKKLLK